MEELKQIIITNTLNKKPMYKSSYNNKNIYLRLKVKNTNKE